jgi:hypothetical protein
MKLEFLAACAVAVVVVGCGGRGGATSLVVGPRMPVHDQSVPTPQKAAYRSVMVVPPQGSERGAVTDLAYLERALLKSGVRVISSGVTGRVVVESAEGTKGGEPGRNLSDLERALVLARKSNADAVLQLIEMRWKDDVPELYRYYWFDAATSHWAEMNKKPDADWYKENRKHEDRLAVVKGPTLGFQAKLIDVDSGEIVAAVDMLQSTVDEVAAKTVVFPKKGRKEIRLASDDLKQAVVDSMMSRLAEIIINGNERAPGKAPAAAPAKAAGKN